MKRGIPITNMNSGTTGMRGLIGAGTKLTFNIYTVFLQQLKVWPVLD